jgi:hypothetical protein
MCLELSKLSLHVSVVTSVQSIRKTYLAFWNNTPEIKIERDQEEFSLELTLRTLQMYTHNIF